MHWPMLAVVSMLGGAGLLWRDEPLAAAWFLGLLVPALFLRSWRVSLLAAAALLAWMAYSYQIHWQSRLVEPARVHALQGWIEGPVVQREFSQHFDWRVDAKASPWHGKTMRVSWYRSDQELDQGQCWLFDLKLRPPRGLLNPGGMDYAAWLFRQRIVAKASVSKSQGCGQKPASWRGRWSAFLNAQLASLDGSSRAKATVRALVLGDRSGMDSAQWEILRRTGTSHLFAISGLHLGLMAGLGWWIGALIWSFGLYRRWPRRQEPAVLMSLLFAIAYAAMSGFAIPVQRALLMYLLTMLALISGRIRQAGSILAFAFVVVVALEPMSLMAPGLWLSFLAAATILLYLWRFPEQVWWQKLVGIQCALCIVLLPVSLYLFEGAALFGAPVNLLVVPLFSAVLPALMLAVALLIAGFEPVMVALLWLLEQLWSGLAWVSDSPLAYWRAMSLELPQVLLVTAVLLSLWLWPGRALRVRAGLALSIILVVLWPSDSTVKKGELALWFLDVGQGQSVLVRTSHHALLYDAGPAWPSGFNAGERVVLPSLRRIGLDRLDAIAISHSDMDHAGGAELVHQGFPAASRWGYAGRPCIAGQQWTWDAVQFEWLHPSQGYEGSDNNQSCVLRITTQKGRSVLLSGDIESVVEQQLLVDGKLRNIDVISVPHHGSQSSSSQPWVEQLSPTLAVVQAGYDNRWRHPHRNVVKRYQDAKVVLYNTASEGALQVRLGARLRWKSLANQRRRLWYFYPAERISAHPSN